MKAQIPSELLEKATVVAKITGANRTEIVAEALREYLEDFEDDDTFKENVIELYFDDYIGFDVLEEFIGREDAEAVRASNSIYDEGEELADDLTDL